MAKRKSLYPGIAEAEAERVRSSHSLNRTMLRGEEPDFVGGAPNYDKFKRWDPESVLVWLNID